MAASNPTLVGLARDQRLQAPSMKNAPAFYRNIEQALDIRRAEHKLLTFKPQWEDTVLDFASSDFLTLNRSGRIREVFLKELARYPDFRLGASGSRTQYGNYSYLIETEQEIADFFKAETAYIAHSGWLANVGVLSAIPLPGDALVFDELVHASTHEGMKLSMATHQKPFRHNDIEHLRELLTNLQDTNSAIRSGTRSVLICVESVYSMEGDVCPLRELVTVVKELFPLGNAQFVVDEAHSTGVLGPKGAGLVAMLGLEQEIAIRLHMSSKALGSTGAVILCNKTVRNALLNNARFTVYSGAPSFPMVASIRAGYKLLMSGETREAQTQLQANVAYFFETLTNHPDYDSTISEGIFFVPLANEWEDAPFLTHIVPIRTRPRYNLYLFFQLMLKNMNAYPMSFPIVPKGKDIIRLVFHVHNTTDQVEVLVECIMAWAVEMMAIEKGKGGLPRAAREVYALSE